MYSYVNYVPIILLKSVGYGHTPKTAITTLRIENKNEIRERIDAVHFP